MLLAIDLSLPSTLLPSPANLEVLSVKVNSQCNRHSVIICNVYISPSSSHSYYTDLLAYLSSLVDSNFIIITGDFNLPDIVWSTLSGSSTVSKLFCDFVFDHNLSQLVTSPTHCKGNILDLVLTNIPDSISTPNVHSQQDCCLSSDHFLLSFSVTFAISTLNRKSPPCHVYDYSKADWDGLLNHLLDTDFTSLYSTSDVDVAWTLLRDTITNATNLYIPKVHIRSNQRPKWFTPDVQHLLNKTRSLRKKYRSSPSPSLKLKLDSSESLLQELMAQAKSTYESNLVKNFAFCSDYKIFSYISNITSHKSIPPSVHLNSSSASSDSGKASLFNQYFNSTFSKPKPFPSPGYTDQPTSSSATLCQIEFSESDVYKALASLDQHKAKGIDGISPKTLARCAPALSEPVYYLFSLCTHHQSLPEEWRIHLITPVFKSGDRSSVTNYRPISLLCILSKVFERIIWNNLIDHVTPSISNVQFGFLKHRSTVHQLLLFLDHLHHSLNHKIQFDAIYLDFSKAFDKVSHHHLLLKLRQFGIDGALWLLLKSYLLNRYHCVSINGSISSKLPVLSGVPQGSILGPLLFLLYVNDLPSAVSSSSLLMFADDTKCLKPIANPRDTTLLQCDLNSLSSWSANWHLPFNSNKCTILHFFSSSSILTPDYYLDSTPLSTSDNHKDLGVIFTTNLSWSHHYSHITTSAYRLLGLLRRSFSSSISISTKKLLYTTLVRSRLTYASQVWRPHLIKDIKKLEQIQRRATKFILNNYHSDYKSRLLSLNLLPLMMTLELNDIMFFIRNFKNPQSCFDISSWVKFSSSSTRASNSNKLHHNVSTSTSNHLYFNRIQRLWNALPQLDLSLSTEALRAQLVKFLWSHFCCSFKPENPCTYHLVCPCNSCSTAPLHINYSTL